MSSLKSIDRNRAIATVTVTPDGSNELRSPIFDTRCRWYYMPAMSSYGIDLEYMNNDQPRSKQLSKIDKFGIGTGLIGLVADVVSLTSLFAISSDSKSVPLHIWLLVLLSIVYSITATNFYARQYFHKCALNNSKKFIRKEVKQIEIQQIWTR